MVKKVGNFQWILNIKNDQIKRKEYSNKILLIKKKKKNKPFYESFHKLVRNMEKE